MAAEMVGFVHPSLAFLGLAALLPFARGRINWKPLTLIPPLVAVATAVWLSFSLEGGQVVLARMHWLGNTLVLARADKLSLVFMHVFALQSLLAAVYALHQDTPAEPAAAALHVGGALGCLLAGDYLTLFVFWELTSLGSTLLIWLKGTDAAQAAGYRYFLFHIFGGLLLLFGLILRYKATGSLAFEHVAPGPLALYDMLILGGFAVNAAVVPLHAWLSDAYPEASAMGSVYLCAFTTKTSVYVLARAFSGFEPLTVAGAAMVLYAGVYALIESDARRSLAYQTIAQVGFMLAGIGVGTELALNGACAHAFAHVAYKGLMFMAVGAVLTSTGTARMERLGGLAKAMPLVAACYLAAAASTSGLPLFGGFTTKSMTIAAASGFNTWLGLALELGALAAILAVGVRLPWLVFFAPKGQAEPVAPVPNCMKAAMAGGALVCLGLGVMPGALYAILPYTVDFQPYTAWSVLQSVMLTGFGVLAFVIAKNVVAPLPGRLADFDMLYGAVGRVFYKLVSQPLAFVDGFWSEVYRTVGLRGLMEKARFAAVFDRKGIDMVVDGAAYAAGHLGGVAATSQTGRLQTYLAASLALAVAVFAGIWLWP